MRWMITDSGLGGLSVCGGLEQALRKIDLQEDIELFYVNATPDDRVGYNALETQAQRIELFDRFLQATSHRYGPDEIVIACNTLSVIFGDTAFAAETEIPVKGIVEAGVDLCNSHLAKHPDHDLIVFATETTTEANTYPRLIDSNGAKVIPQPCPELAHAISNDATGAEAAALIAVYSKQAILSVRPNTSHLFAFLACTHYGYQADLFESILNENGFGARSLDPNQLLVNRLVATLDADAGHGKGHLTVRFISRYEIPEVEMRSMESYLKDNSPLTIAALRGHEIVPPLFDRP